MKLLLAYLKPYSWLIVLTLLLGAITQIFFLLDKHFLGIIIDKFATHPHEALVYNGKSQALLHTRSKWEFFTGVLKYLGLIICLSMISNVAKIFQDYFVTVIVQKSGAQLYTDGLKRSMELPYEAFEDQRSGETLDILRNVRAHTEEFLVSFIHVIFGIFISAVYVIIYSFTLHWSIIIFYITGTFILTFISIALTKKIKVIQETIVPQTLSLAGSTTESLQNIELIKSMGLTDREEKRLGDKISKITGLKLKWARAVRSLTFIQGGFIYFLCLLIFILLLFLTFHHLISTGKLITLLFYSFFVFAPFRQVNDVILSYRILQVSMRIFRNFLEKPSEAKPVEPIDTGSMQKLEFKNVYFKHQTASHYAIEDLSFNVKAGQTIAFVGPSGAGKSTLVKVLVGLYHPKKGEILYNEINGKDIDFDRFRSHIGLVTQTPELFSGTIKENLLFVNPAATEAELKYILEITGFQNLLERTENGIDTLIGEGGMKLSGGEKQRLSIARALLRDPKLLIFDEATSSLDSINEELVTLTIRAVSSRKELITILIAHRLSTIIHADEIYVLEKGRVVETGTHKSLVDEKGLYYAMWRQQIGEKLVC